jgi:hypothetical protein
LTIYRGIRIPLLVMAILNDVFSFGIDLQSMNTVFYSVLGTFATHALRKGNTHFSRDCTVSVCAVGALLILFGFYLISRSHAKLNQANNRFS